MTNNNKMKAEIMRLICCILLLFIICKNINIVKSNLSSSKALDINIIYFNDSTDSNTECKNKLIILYSFINSFYLCI